MWGSALLAYGLSAGNVSVGCGDIGVGYSVCTAEVC